MMFFSKTATVLVTLLLLVVPQSRAHDDDHASKNLRSSSISAAIASVERNEERLWLPSSAKIHAEIDQDNFKATVTGIQYPIAKTAAVWRIDIQSLDKADLCASEDGLFWHIHTEPLGAGDVSPTDCGNTLLHWDPTFGCGGASEYKDTLCASIANHTGRPNPQTCNLRESSSTCEFGDLSGKLGQVRLQTGVQTFFDPYLTNLEEIKDLSIVFHCGSPRVACANFAMV